MVYTCSGSGKGRAFSLYLRRSALFNSLLDVSLLLAVLLRNDRKQLVRDLISHNS